MSTENYFKKRELKDKILKSVENYKLEAKIEKSKIALTNQEVREIVSILEQIPKFYGIYPATNSYKEVEGRFLENGKTIQKVLELLKK